MHRAAGVGGTASGLPGVLSAPGLLLLAAGLGALPLISLPVALVFLVVWAALAAVIWFPRFELLLHLMVLSVFVESVGIGPLRVGRLLAVVAVLALVCRATLTGWRPSLQVPVRAILPVAGFLLWAVASGLWTSSPSAWTYAMGQLALAVCYFAAFVLGVERREQLGRLLRTMVLGGLFAAAVAFAQVAAGAPRAVGLQGDPNIYALYQVACLPAAAFLAVSGPVRQRWIGWVALPVLVLSVVATSSRGGLATALVVIVIMFARGDFGRRLARNRTAAVTIAVTTAVTALAVLMTYNKRFSPERVLTDRASGRLDIWYVAFREWQSHPVLGIGGGGFRPRSVELLATEPGVQLVKSHLLLSSGIEVHNIYLETLVEYGVVGFLLFVSVLVCTWWHLHRAALASRDPVLRALPMLLIAFLTASFFLSVINNKLLWMLIALSVLAAGQRLPRETPAGRSGRQPRSGHADASPRLRRLLLLLLLPTVGAGLGTALAPASWTAATQFVVSTDATSTAARASAVRTLETLATSRVVAAEVVGRGGTRLTAAQLADRVRVERPAGALTFTVSIDGEDRSEVRGLAVALRDAFSSRVATLSGGVQGDSETPIFLQSWGQGQVTVSQLPAPILRNGLLGLSLGVVLAALVLSQVRRPDLEAHVPAGQRPVRILTGAIG